MGRKNVAFGDDVVAVQAGQVHGRRDANTADVEASAANDTTGRTQNSISGNARVGIQADTVTGPIHIRL